jgi:hypothetical protein
VDIKTWYKKRGPLFIWQRGINLLDRYSLGTGKVSLRIKGCLEKLVEMECLPTFFTPASLVLRNPAYICSLQETGAEISVHGFYHINLGDIPMEDAVYQLLKAVQTFEYVGIKPYGFRCPYIGYSDRMLDAIPGNVFDYSSNQAILWNVVDNHDGEQKSRFFETLSKFYQADDSSSNVCLPWNRSNTLEIPICLPDDLQLIDGLQYDQLGIIQVWDKILNYTHLRGELFTLIFHTELASFCENPLSDVIRHARQYQPAVWITRLHDISEWWREKANFKNEITPTSKGMRLSFICSPRATILVRGLNIGGLGIPWCDSYYMLRSLTLEVPANPRPFIGLASDVPESTVSFLREQGYILDMGETAVQCGIYLDALTLSKLVNKVQLIDYIETSVSPLVRYWRWPNGARSALSITGDLDALSLMDYVSRLFVS